LEDVRVFAAPDEVPSDSITVVTAPVDDSKPAAATLTALGGSFGDLLGGTLSQGTLTPVPGQWNLHLTDNSIRDLWILITWGSG